MLKMTIDASRGVYCAKKFDREGRNQLRNALNKAAREGRTAFIELLPGELRLANRGQYVVRGGAAADFTAARAENLTSIYRPSRKSYNLAEVIGLSVGKDGVRAQHNVISGGGSANLHAPHAFKIKGGAKRGLVVNRIEFREGARLKRAPRGTHNPQSLHRRGIRSMKTTTPAAVMSQEGNPLREAWWKATSTRLEAEIPPAINLAAERAGFNLGAP